MFHSYVRLPEGRLSIWLWYIDMWYFCSYWASWTTLQQGAPPWRARIRRLPASLRSPWLILKWCSGWWFQVSTPLRKLVKYVGMMKFPMYGKIKSHVPNHQARFLSLFGAQANVVSSWSLLSGNTTQQVTNYLRGRSAVLLKFCVLFLIANHRADFRSVICILHTIRISYKHGIRTSNILPTKT